MDEFINKVIENSDTDSIEQYVTNNIRDSLGFGYNRNVNLASIYPKSFLIQRECSQEAFTNIYSELGYDMLKQYIELVKSTSIFSSYINDSSRQIVAMKFLLFKTDHHSSKGFRRDVSAKTIYQVTSNNLTETINIITREKQTPKRLTKEQRDLFNKLAQTMNEQPPVKKRGLFG